MNSDDKNPEGIDLSRRDLMLATGMTVLAGAAAVQSMDRAYEFYTEVLGGTEVMRDGDFKGEAIHNTIMTDQEILARQLGGTA